MTKKIEAKEEVGYDIYWKDLISLMIEDFIAFFMPDLHPQIDYSVPPVFLEQELNKLLSDLKKKGIRFCDTIASLTKVAKRNLYLIIEHIAFFRTLKNHYIKIKTRFRSLYWQVGRQ